MNISELLQGETGSQIISEISKKIGSTDKEVSAMLNEAAPMLLEMLHKNSSSSKEGEESLSKALEQHDGSILDKISGSLDHENAAVDGHKILGNILGENRNSVEEALASKTGVDSSKISGALVYLAPVIMGYLGKQHSASGNKDLPGLLNSLLQGSSSALGTSIISSLLSGKSGFGGILERFLSKKK
ncbi:DUF937 domain-containing protein [Candidatus Nitrosacidococcus sp. I8]|uniref:DUF937 domain-containing protein n=1 Tax=Candidatus Nitrosacidococcus sp. I8 TaxID=2942908 RepID=UPI0022275769|nr:DUF937 domain-containing protein [Candidatus Nitrosacidococcus sp. I8]CAH9018412.1 hypothetical protein NURINAE_00908 [Candidatus Nitrosacidococcus sp. I8]